MTAVLLGGLVALAAAVTVEGYAIFGVIQRLRTTFEQILAANQSLLAAIPGKSAAPTVAPIDAPAYVPFQGLRALARLAFPTDTSDLDRWADDGGADVAEHIDPEPITEPIPVIPVTEPQARVEVVGGARLPFRPTPHKRGRHAA